MLSFDPSKDDFSKNYKFLIGGILPRPIAVVSTRNSDGSNNLAPFSFFTGVSAEPMIVAFCPLIRSSDGQKKDTVLNIEREKEFVINICSFDICEQVNLASTEFDRNEDEFIQAGLTPIPSEVIKASRVKESPVHYECKLRDILSYGEHKGAGTLIAGEVVKVHVDEKAHQDGRIITQEISPVGRGAGNDWFKTDQPFEMKRLMKSQIQK